MAFKHGHYIDSGLSLEEIDSLLQEAIEEENQIKSCDDLPVVFEDQDSDYDKNINKPL